MGLEFSLRICVLCRLNLLRWMDPTWTRSIWTAEIGVYGFLKKGKRDRKLRDICREVRVDVRGV